MYRRYTKQRVALAALVAAAATVITLDFRQRPGGPIERAQEVVMTVLAPLQDGLARIFAPVGDFLSGLSELPGIREENQRLRGRVEELEFEQRRLPEVLRENDRLKQLAQIEDWTKGRRLGARVIGNGPSNQEWSIFIDKGRAEGLRTSMAVVSSEGLIGRVVVAATRYSKVLLMIDTEHSVGSRLTRTGETGVIGGRGSEDLRFDFIDPKVKVELGETVVTSGFDRGVYPGGIPIGRVTKILGSASGLTNSALVSPFVQFGRLDFVAVLLDSGPSGRER